MSVETFNKRNFLEINEEPGGRWVIRILDPKLTSKVVSSAIKMVMEGKTHGQIKKELGLWFNIRRLNCIKYLIKVSQDETLAELMGEYGIIQ